MDGEPNARSMRGIARRLDDCLLRGQVISLAVNEPDLEEIWLVRQLLLCELSRCFRRADLDDRRIAQVELRPVDHRSQRSRNRHAGSGRALSCRIPRLEVPERAAYVSDRGNSARQPNLEGRRKSRL